MPGRIGQSILEVAQMHDVSGVRIPLMGMEGSPIYQQMHTEVL